MLKPDEDITEEQARLRKQLQKLCQNVNREIYNKKNHYLGKVLTITDSVTTDPEQRKALKDVIQSAFWADTLPESYNDPITWQFRQFAEAQGFELWDKEDHLNNQYQPVNQYEEIK